MKQFFKFFFASLLGTVIGFFVLCFIGFVAIASISAGLASKSKAKEEAKPNSVLTIKLNYDIKERSSDNPFEEMNFSFEPSSNLGLNDLIKNIKDAKSDDNIKGIYIESAIGSFGLATLEALRNALLDFKSSGKFIVAYGEIFTQKSYYLASVADEIYVNPVGFVDFRGFYSEIMFLKGMLEKLEIEPQVLYAGKYKSATEPFRLEKMSDENREQISYIINDAYDHFITKISAARGFSPATLDSIADNGLVRDVEDALALNMVDGLLYFDQVLAKLKEKTGTGEKDDLPQVNIQKYGKKEGKKKPVKDKIAVLYAQGAIVDGKGDSDEIGSEKYAKAIREIRKDENVKALVFRINSGGGSALASDVILREIALTKEKMPVIVTMGDVAASGGYYIACYADSILAEPNSITGSIGVFGLLPNMQAFFKNKMGITFDGVKTGKYSDMGNVSRPLTAEERAIIQTGIDSIYHDFLAHVAKGRETTVAYVNEIGQGRVWTGRQALQNKLVDALGGLDDAIAIAAEKAGLAEYDLKAFPRQKKPLEQFLEDFGSNAKTAWLKKEMGEYYTLMQKAEALKKLKGAQALMPFYLEIY